MGGRTRCERPWPGRARVVTVGASRLVHTGRSDAHYHTGMAAHCVLLGEHVQMSFSVDSGEAVRMLHPAAEDVPDVLPAPPDVGLPDPIAGAGRGAGRARRPGKALARF